MKHLTTMHFAIAAAMMAVCAVAYAFDPSSSPVVWAAVVALKSTVITNADALPAVINQAGLARARVLSMRGIANGTNGDSIGSTYRVCRIKSSDFIEDVLLDNATWGAACTADIGLYDTAANGGAVVDADFFASAVDMNTVHSKLDVTREAAAGPATIANSEKRVWEMLGLTTDPGKDFDVALTLVAAAAATGSALLTVRVNGND